MKAVFVALLFSVADGLRRRSDPGTQIVNGTRAPACTWKWQVGLYSRGSNQPSCGGTLISPTWVVTARHCVQSGGSTDVMGGDILPGRGQRRSSRRIITKSDQDMALIELSSPFDLDNCFNVPNLPTSEVPDGTQCWITGWGRLGANSPGASTLMQAQTNVVSYQQCRSQMGGNHSSKDVCVFGYYNGNPTSGCYGDSGGPLVCDTGGGYTLYGATSWGRSCQGITIYAGVYSAMSWIGSYVGNGPGPSPTPPSGCSDLNGNCRYWASAGYCSPSSPYHQYMRDNCCASCGFGR